jgi:hypothetical protein
MDFDRFIDQAWADHAEAPAAVAARIAAEGPALLQDAGQALRLAQLVAHVHGAHLAQWHEGDVQLVGLGALPACANEADGADGTNGTQSAATATGILRLRAGLAIASGLVPAPELAALDPLTHARAQGLAAAHLVERDPSRARTLLMQARSAIENQPADSPAWRDLAIAGNNLASEICERSGPRGAADMALMLQAAQVGLDGWRRAGGWREHERAEYRLSVCHAVAGNADAARRHARACVDILAAQGEAASAAKEPLEWFFAHEAAARAERAAAASAFAQLPAEDQAWCRASLQALGGAA